MKKTRFFNDVEQKWVLIDAKDKILGRLSVRIAAILQGKTKPKYTPNFICGDKVIVVNARHFKVSGKKMQDKFYQKYSGYPSGRKEINLKSLMEKNPAKIIYYAVKGMLPKNKLGRKMLKSLKIYPEQEHFHQAQKPEAISV